MAIKTFVVTRYEIMLGDRGEATWGGVAIKARGAITCYGDDHRFILYFLASGSAVASPVFNPATKVGAIFLPFAEMDGYVDLVRNEGPINAYLNSDKPEWNHLRTGAEAPGEGE